MSKAEEAWLYAAANKIERVAFACEDKLVHWKARIAVHAAAAALRSEAEWLETKRKADK